MAETNNNAAAYRKAGGVYYPLQRCWKWTDEDGLLDRDGDKPAMIEDIGGKFWARKGKLTRDDAPAYKHPNGSFVWYRDGVIHRLTGKAAYFAATGESMWFIEGKAYKTQEEFEAAREKYYEDHDIVAPGRSTKRA